MEDLTLESLARHHWQRQLELTEEANELRVAKLKEAAAHAYRVKLILARLFRVSISKIEIGSWICEKSPIFKCVYDTEQDPAMDHCLVCGDPDERK